MALPLHFPHAVRLPLGIVPGNEESAGRIFPLQQIQQGRQPQLRELRRRIHRMLDAEMLRNAPFLQVEAEADLRLGPLRLAEQGGQAGKALENQAGAKGGAAADALPHFDGQRQQRTPLAGGAHQQLRANHLLQIGRLNLPEKAGFNQLKAVDVDVRPQVEQPLHHEVAAVGYRFAPEGVIPLVGTAGQKRKAQMFGAAVETEGVGRGELQIGVQKRGVAALGGLQPGTQRRAVAPVGFVPEEAEAGGRRHCVQQLKAPVRTAIVHCD